MIETNAPGEGDLLIRLIRWGVRKAGWQALGMLTLLLIALGSSVYSLLSVVRGLDPWLLWPACFTGLLAGWILARSRIPGWLSGILAVLLGAGGVLVRIGQLGPQLLPAIRAANELAAAILRWYPGLPAPDVSPTLAALSRLGASLVILVTRVWDWLSTLGSSGAVFDPVAVALVWSLALWLVSTWAGWAMRRWNQPLQALVPVTALLGTSLAYTGSSGGRLLPILAVALLLVAWTSYSAHEKRWQKEGVDYSEEIHFDLFLITVFVTAALTVMAGVSATVSLSRFVDFANRLFQPAPGNAPSNAPPIGESLGLRPRPVPENESQLLRSRAPGLPRKHLLGSGPELSDQLALTVRTGELPPGPPEIVMDRPVPRYYWRSLTYDTYTGSGWVTGATQTIAYPGDEPAQAAGGKEIPFLSQRLVQQEVRLAGGENIPGQLIHAAGALAWVDQDYQVAWRTRPGTGDSAIGDIFGASTDVNTYRVRSLVSDAREEQLRAASRDYPAWIASRYLALPDSVPNRVLTLARDLTATGATPYDRARAIEAYLRSFPYTLDLPLPPGGRDVVDYFLFDLQKGFCDYYASAMVVLSRAAGLPARLVVGYASGSYDSYSASYVVTEADAHSWPEIYFPGYGWVEFEPTSGRPPLEHAGGAEIPAPVPESGSAPPGLRIPGGWPHLLYWAGTILGLAGLLVLAWFWIDLWRIRRLPPGGAIAALWRRLYRIGEDLKVPAKAGDTPYEFSASLAKRVSSLAKDVSWGRYVSPAVQEAHQLTDLYARSTFSPRHPETVEQLQAIQLWSRLRLRLLLARLRIRNPLYAVKKASRRLSE